MAHAHQDEDMKIAPDDITRLFEEDHHEADDTINIFLHQRAVGNLVRAHHLGGALVEDLLGCVSSVAPEGVNAYEYELQMRLLFCYVANRVIEDDSPNTVLAHTALSAFYERMDDAQPDMFDCLSDTAAFSLYLYLHRSGEETVGRIGEIFAKLCGVPDSEVCKQAGEEAYIGFTHSCRERLKEAGYRQ